MKPEKEFSQNGYVRTIINDNEDHDHLDGGIPTAGRRGAPLSRVGRRGVGRAGGGSDKTMRGGGEGERKGVG